jgi:hypothetical protein
MAQKKKRRGRWGRRVLFYIFVPLLVWGAAFLVWFYWYDLKTLVAKESPSIDRRPRQINREEAERGPGKTRAQEKIPDEDRKKLEDIIKRRG